MFKISFVFLGYVILLVLFYYIILAVLTNTVDAPVEDQIRPHIIATDGLTVKDEWFWVRSTLIYKLYYYHNIGPVVLQAWCWLNEYPIATCKIEWQAGVIGWNVESSFKWTIK